ncbi:LacI family DNA-binding transcriptional regulator [uncultured Limosilactobacillus sp.]|uniref:LacI family DNA-binding transcriptional regulator n=1 Tax=uncultured Limosilactobacillus sp. TaxID=2837629 RepID=UPI0025E7773E|nr:LacI family DNA-binding transcriptional regulator [uncultured Limosilactobacillus sp.]
MASIRDIAKEAGVSPATVSRVLSQDKKFSVRSSTRKRVMEVVNKLHYDPREHRDMVQPIPHRDRQIIVLCSLTSSQETRDLYFATIDEAIHEEAEMLHIKVGAFVRFPNPTFDYAVVEKFDGVIIIGTFSERFLNSLHRFNRNMVVVDEYRYFDQFDLVRNNYHDETVRTLDLLYQQGHRKIAFIGGEINQMEKAGITGEKIMDIRTSAYLNWMQIHHLHSKNLTTDWSTHEGYQAMEELLNSDTLPTAAMVASDQLAIGAYRSIQLHHLVIPEDLEVVSFNDSQVASYLVPSLSSVHAPSKEMGRSAVRLLLDRWHNRRTVPWQVVLPSKLILRESTTLSSKKG